MKLAIINDLHLGVQRSAGTTPVSAQALREYATRQYRRLLQMAADELDGDGWIIVNGDLTDKFDVELADALDLFEVTATFLQSNPDILLGWATGNHDLSKDSSKIGTVEFIGTLLNVAHSNFCLVDEPTDLGDGLYIIPHMVNQEEFDDALEAVPMDTKYLLLHANFDNNFAAQADHSLNLSREQARRLTQTGITVIMGHEHQGRTAFGGKVVISGNQFPTSVADCLSQGDGQKDGKKYMTVVKHGDVQMVETWNKDGSYLEVDWRETENLDPALQFIRVSGDASAEEASEALRAISRLRKEHSAFVITNAVKVESAHDEGEITASIEEIGKVDVITLLKEFLTPEQAARVTELMEEQ